MTFRIHRSTRASGVVLSLSGDLEMAYVRELQKLLASETNRAVHLDLRDVTLVDRDAVTFLAQIELRGATLVNCPDYVRSWINAEQGRRLPGDQDADN